MVEAAANSVQDHLIDGLSFKLKEGSTYVTDRRSITYHPSGSNIYSPMGTRLISIKLTGDNWMDPSTFRIMFDLVNTDTRDYGSFAAGACKTSVRPQGGPYAFFKRMRVLAGGVVLEDIDDFNRVSHMFSILESSGSLANKDSEGFGNTFNLESFANGDQNIHMFSGVLQGESQTVMFKPLCGILSQKKYIPLRYTPLTIELELVSNEEDPVVSNFVTVSNNPVIDAGMFDVSNTIIRFTNINTTTKWTIQNVQAKCDVITLDSQLEEIYASHLLSGKTLPINYSSYISQVQTINGNEKVRLNVTRSLTRLKACYVTLDKKLKTGTINNIGRKNWNDFYSPMSYANSARAVVADFVGSGYQNANIDHRGIGTKHSEAGEFQFQLQLGNKLYPEYPIRSHAEGYYQLRKSLGVQSNHLHSFDIKSNEYRNNKFILGIDYEKILNSGFTGANTRIGDIMNIRFDHSSALPEANRADLLYVVLQSDCILEITGSGVNVLD